MRLHCPTCHSQIEAGSLPPGATASCPICHGLFQVPAQVAPQPSVPSPSEPVSEKTATLVSRVGWGLLILCAFALLGAGSGYLVFHFAQWQETRRTAPQTAPAPPRATAEPNDATAVWQSLGHWSGAGMQRTPAFRTSGSRFRIHWSAMPRDSAEKEDNFALHVTDRAGKQLQTPVSIVGAGSDTAYVGIKPGTYFLEVFTFDTQWEITIEEPR